MTYKELERILLSHGYKQKRSKGSHRIFCKPGCRPEIVPFHGKEVPEGIAKDILKRVIR